jgi:N-methylhydantoinase A/oxoprolinase/acetone carboxylase beta subunit
MKIGVDVGGTNTDVVILDNEGVLGWHKTPTTEDVFTGVVEAISSTLQKCGLKTNQIDGVMIGTTQFTNAVIQRKGLLPVGIIRLCLPAATAVPPLSDWPDDLSELMGDHQHLIAGGFEFDGRPISPLDKDALRRAGRILHQQGIQTLAVTSVFSPINDEMERQAAAILRQEMPGVSVSLSSEVGQYGLLTRENSTIINASLVELAQRVVGAFRQALQTLRLKVPFFISQNDGTLMPADDVARFPVLTFASGPTNSLRGAAYLAGVQDAMVADIGGTTTDIGMLRNGFPRQSTHLVDVGGVKTNFRMPDVLAIGLGGGSLVTQDGHCVGPESVGYLLNEQAFCFGGDQLTASDIAVAGGWAKLGDNELLRGLPREVIEQARKTMQHMLDRAVERMKTDPKDLPLIVVGGGGLLIDWPVQAVSEVLQPPYAQVANAIGAAIAQVSGQIEQIVTLTESNRNEILGEAQQLAKQRAIDAGANPESLEIVEVDLVPISYLPDNPTRVRIKVVGDLPL